VSLPFVALVVLALTGGVIYAFFSIGRVPIKLVLILGVGAAVTLYAIVRSCFVKVRDDEDPGRGVTEADAPGLWETAREVAAAVGTRPVDEIWLTPGTDLAVFERGSMGERMKDRARRALILGAGVLDGFEQHAFCAVLAHEYGHFSHRDTAGGDVALRVRHGMFQFAMALAAAGYAVWWNLGFQFLRLYDFLFRRISHGATRLQEVLADRVAVQKFGFESFKEGLTHAIRRSIQFENLAGHEIEHAIEERRAVANLYGLKLSEDPEARADVERRVREALEAETSEDDTHPSPNDRLRLASRIPATSTGHRTGMVWELFRDPAGLMAEMTALIARRVAERTAAPAES
jgi:Zn-dependent protease with chaperone function